MFTFVLFVDSTVQDMLLYFPLYSTVLYCNGVLLFRIFFSLDWSR